MRVICFAILLTMLAAPAVAQPECDSHQPAATGQETVVVTPAAAHLKQSSAPHCPSPESSRCCLALAGCGAAVMASPASVTRAPVHGIATFRDPPLNISTSTPVPEPPPPKA